MRAAIGMLFVLMMWGCSEDASEDGACEMAAELTGCDECADGDVTCSFEGTSVTKMSCGTCQAEAGLLESLCSSGSTATREEINKGMVCEPS